MAGIPPSVEHVPKELTIIYELICMSLKSHSGTSAEVCKDCIVQFLNRGQKALTFTQLIVILVVVDVVLCCGSDVSQKEDSSTVYKLHYLCVKYLPQVKGRKFTVIINVIWCSLLACTVAQVHCICHTE